RGMSQFADGGLIATKPYAGSANYIHNMSDYCSGCHYDRHKKYGERACPFNSLYWDFYARHRQRLQNNPRMTMMYRAWDRMSITERKKILQQAEVYKQHLQEL
ncbi:MAG: cryptochrome/photolyase family protein, partial [candidate division KSB1 bacterium]|nr:cryptochrome/photolyase family protein [candidate division KSB1 bacterium]